MNVTFGENVDLIFPFPLAEAKRAFGWSHCYRTITETDDNPQTQELFVASLENTIRTIPTWGIIDKNHITSLKHEAPLVGIGIFEPQVVPGTGVIRSGIFHVATARKAWKTGLIDEAAHLVIQNLFSEIPTLLRVGGIMMEKNYPAKSLAKRVGFKFEGILEDAILKDGKPENLALFGLTRRNYRWDNKLEQQQSGQGADSSGHSLEVQDSLEVPLKTEPQVESLLEPALEPLVEPQV